MSITAIKPSMWCPGIRQGHPLGPEHGLVALWPFWDSVHARDIVGRYHMTAYNSPIMRPTELGQAILFDDAQTEYLEHAVAVQATVPLSLSAWARTDVPATQQSVLGLGFTGAPRYIRIKISNSTALAQITGGGTHIDLTGGAISANTWHHIGGTFTEAEVGIYVDGAETLNGAGSTVPAGLNLTTIGVRHTSAFAHYMSGDFAMPAIWNRALSDAEFEELNGDPWGLITPRRRIYSWAAASATPAAGGPFPHYTRRRMTGGMIALGAA